MGHTAAEVIDRARELVDLTRQVLEILDAIPLVWEVEIPLFGDAHLSIQLIP